MTNIQCTTMTIFGQCHKVLNNELKYQHVKLLFPFCLQLHRAEDAARQSFSSNVRESSEEGLIEQSGKIKKDLS